MQRNTTRTTATSNESGLSRHNRSDHSDRKSVKRPTEERDIVRSVAEKNFEFSPSQLDCTIFRSTLLERRRRRESRVRRSTRARTLVACNRPRETDRGKKPQNPQFLDVMLCLINASRTVGPII